MLREGPAEWLCAPGRPVGGSRLLGNRGDLLLTPPGPYMLVGPTGLDRMQEGPSQQQVLCSQLVSKAGLWASPSGD